MRQGVLMRLQGLGILVAMGAAVCGAAYLASGPLLEARDAAVAAHDQFKGFEASFARDSQIQTVDTSEVIQGEATDAVSLSTQRAIVDLVQAAGLVQRELQVLPQRIHDRDVVQLSFRLSLNGDLDQFTKFTSGLTTRRPVIFIDSLEMTSGSAHRGDLGMSIQIELSAFAAQVRAAP